MKSKSQSRVHLDDMARSVGKLCQYRIWPLIIWILVSVLVPGTARVGLAEDVPDLDNEMDALERVIEAEEGDDNLDIDDADLEEEDFDDDFRDVASDDSRTVVDDDFDDELGDDEDLDLDDDVLGVPGEDEFEDRGRKARRDPDLDELDDLDGELELEGDPALSELDDDQLEELDVDSDEGTEADDLDLKDLPGVEFTEQGTEESQPTQPSDPGIQVKVTDLEFKMEGANSRIVVSSNGSLRYRMVMNPQMKQVVLFFENTNVPDRLQRAYDTTEFRSPVALFTLLQVPNEVPPTSKLIIQLREDSEPRLLPTERGLFIDFGPPLRADDPRLVLDRGQNSGQASELNIYDADQVFTGRIIKRLEIKNSDVQDVLRLIAKTSGYNIVIGDDVNGSVGTLSLENIPWDQAFTLVLQTKKLGYVRQGNVLRVATLSSLAREKSDALANEQARARVETLKTLLIPVSYAQAAQLAAQGQNFLTDRGSINTDDRTNTIILKDIPRVVEKVQKLYQALDTQPPRVNVGARIVEVANTFSQSFGMSSLTTGSAALNLTLNPDLGVGLGIDSGGGGIAFSRVASAFTAKETEGQVRTLANPSVSVVANQAAVVNQSFSFFVDRQIFVPGSNSQVSGTQEVTTNLTLEVTPIVSGDGTIFAQVTITNEIPNLTDPESPKVDTRNIDTQVLLDDGDTVLLGSIFSNTINKAVTGVPFLMKIPILGPILSSNVLTDNRNEVFVFLTAKIMNAEEAFKRVL